MEPGTDNIAMPETPHWASKVLFRKPFGKVTEGLSIFRYSHWVSRYLCIFGHHNYFGSLQLTPRWHTYSGMSMIIITAHSASLISFFMNFLIASQQLTTCSFSSLPTTHTLSKNKADMYGQMHANPGTQKSINAQKVLLRTSSGALSQGLFSLYMCTHTHKHRVSVDEVRCVQVQSEWWRRLIRIKAADKEVHDNALIQKPKHVFAWVSLYVRVCDLSDQPWPRSPRLHSNRMKQTDQKGKRKQRENWGEAKKG